MILKLKLLDWSNTRWVREMHRGILYSITIALWNNKAVMDENKKTTTVTYPSKG